MRVPRFEIGNLGSQVKPKEILNTSGRYSNREENRTNKQIKRDEVSKKDLRDVLWSPAEVFKT